MVVNVKDDRYMRRESVVSVARYSSFATNDGAALAARWHGRRVLEGRRRRAEDPCFLARHVCGSVGPHPRGRYTGHPLSLEAECLERC